MKPVVYRLTKHRLRGPFLVDFTGNCMSSHFRYILVKYSCNPRLSGSQCLVNNGDFQSQYINTFARGSIIDCKLCILAYTEFISRFKYVSWLQ